MRSWLVGSRAATCRKLSGLVHPGARVCWLRCSRPPRRVARSWRSSTPAIGSTRCRVQRPASICRACYGFVNEAGSNRATCRSPSRGRSRRRGCCWMPVGSVSWRSIWRMCRACDQADPHNDLAAVVASARRQRDRRAVARTEPIARSAEGQTVSCDPARSPVGGQVRTTGTDCYRGSSVRPGSSGPVGHSTSSSPCVRSSPAPKNRSQKARSHKEDGVHRNQIGNRAHGAPRGRGVGLSGSPRSAPGARGEAPV